LLPSHWGWPFALAGIVGDARSVFSTDGLGSFFM
jgi:hypothetical protein